MNVAIAYENVQLSGRKAAVSVATKDGVRNILVVTIITFFSSVGVGLFLSRHISKPIRNLRDASIVVGKGRLDIRVDIRSKDETGDLAFSFNQMVEALQQADEQLHQEIIERQQTEARIDERTAELESSDDQLIAEINERQRLEEGERLRNQEMAVADEVARIVTSTLNIDEVYEKFALEVKKLVDFERLSINLIDHQAGVFTTKYLVGEHRLGRHLGWVKTLEGSRTKHIIETGQTLVRGDIAEESQYPGDLDDVKAGMRSSIFVPLITKGRGIGVLRMRSREVDAYGPWEQAILERLAGQIAPAIENSQLYGRLQASVDEMDLADEVGRIVTSTLDTDEVYEKFAMELKKLVDFDRVNIKLVDLEAKNYTLKYLFGPARAGHPVGTVEPLENCQTQQVAATQRTLIENDIGANPTFRTDHYFSNMGLPCNITVPLVLGDRVNGTISLRSRHVGAYGPRQQAILEPLPSMLLRPWKTPGCTRNGYEPRSNSPTPRRWKAWAAWPVVWPMTSTTCLPPLWAIPKCRCRKRPLIAI